MRLRGAVEIIRRVWHALRTIAAGRKHVESTSQKFTACSTPAREPRVTEKHVVQTSDQSAQTGGKVNRKKVKQNGGFFDLNEYFVLSSGLVT